MVRPRFPPALHHQAVPGAQGLDGLGDLGLAADEGGAHGAASGGRCASSPAGGWWVLMRVGVSPGELGAATWAQGVPPGWGYSALRQPTPRGHTSRLGEAQWHTPGNRSRGTGVRIFYTSAKQRAGGTARPVRISAWTAGVSTPYAGSADGTRCSLGTSAFDAQRTSRGPASGCQKILHPSRRRESVFHAHDCFRPKAVTRPRPLAAGSFHEQTPTLGRPAGAPGQDLPPLVCGSKSARWREADTRACTPISVSNAQVPRQSTVFRSGKERQSRRQFRVPLPCLKGRQRSLVVGVLFPQLARLGAPLQRCRRQLAETLPIGARELAEMPEAPRECLRRDGGRPRRRRQ